ncbi:MAG: helix-turn-helix domain-containing protein [Bacteroidia bacterium]
MQSYKVNDPKKKETILINIRSLRNLKTIKQETMAMELGISKSEYSKLENGFKQNWEKYWEKIGEILGIHFYELAFDDCLFQTQNGNVKSNTILSNALDNDI